METWGEHGLTDVDGSIYPLAETQSIVETHTEGKLVVVCVHALTLVISRVLVVEDAHCTEVCVRDEVPETGLLVAAYGVGNVPHNIAVEIPELEFLDELVIDACKLGTVHTAGETLIADAHAEIRDEPLADIDVEGTAYTAGIAVGTVHKDVYTACSSYEPVSAKTVGEIRTAYDLAVLIPVFCSCFLCAD